MNKVINASVTIIWIAICLFSVSLFAQSTDPLNDDGELHAQYYSTHGNNHVDYHIPENTPFNAVTFALRGGDGGYAQAGASDDCRSQGGDGAVTELSILIGDGENQLPRGTHIRFIIGANGQFVIAPGTQLGAGGGGGGTAVLFNIDGGSDNWEILAVAGGGGGAYQGNLLGICIDSQGGQGGRNTTSGGDGAGAFSGNGGTNGGGGDGGGTNGGGDLSGGGGGAFSNGTGNFDKEGKAGFPEGGNGGQGTGVNGGWGFGGGGVGQEAGGGGGGYSGGGGGGNVNNGGGGGSFVHPTYAFLAEITAGGRVTGTNTGAILYEFSNACVVDITGFEYINPLCTDEDQGRIQFDHSIIGGSGCEDVLEWSLAPLNGWHYLGDGVFRSMRAGNYTLNVKNTTLNEVVATYDFTIAPNGIAPEARCKDVSVTLVDGLYANPNFANLINNGSTSFCDEPLSLSATHTSFDCTDDVEAVGLTVTGHNGVSSFCTSVVTVIWPEDEHSIAKCKPTFSIDLAGGNTGLVVSDIDDNSDLSLCWLDHTINVSQLSCSDLGTVEVTMTIVDWDGTTDQCATIINVVDSGQPVANCVTNKELILQGDGTAILTSVDLNNGSVSNNCSALSYAIDVANFNCDDIGNTTVTLTVTDGYNRSSSCQTTVNVLEIASPVALCQDITIYLDDDGNADFTVEDIDNGSNAGCQTNLSSSVLSFDCDAAGEQLVTLTATSVLGTEATCQATVTVQDTIAPTANCLDHTIQLSRSGIATYLIFRSQFFQNSSDNCGIRMGDFLDRSLLTCEDIPTRVVGFYVQDEAGNRDTCYSTFTVFSDATPAAAPVPICTPNITIELDDEGTFTPAMYDIYEYVINSELSPGCGGNNNLLFTANIPTFDCNDIGAPFPVEFTITQEGFPPSSCTSSVTVVDDENPVCQNAVVLVNMKVFLAGTYDDASGLMADQLREQGLIPLSSPYPGTAAVTTSAVLATTGENAIVDWVLVELRNELDNTEVLYSRAGLLQRDGEIVDVDGESLLLFPDAPSGAYYVAIQHRNHLGTMTSTVVLLDKAIPQG